MTLKSTLVCAWLVLSMFCLSAQKGTFVQTGTAIQTSTADYDAKWNTVDSLITKAYLAESALAAIDRIYTIAHREHNDAQEIKALVYRMIVGSEKQEEADTAAIRTLEAAIGQAAEPSRSILQSLLAQLYWDYLQQNRWKLYERTATVNIVKGDIGTWTIDDLHQKIGGLYLASLKHEKILLQTRLADYDPILVRGNARYLRPTLFDVLAHEALDYFRQAGSDVNQPADVFEIDDPAVFEDAAAFAGHVFHSIDTTSMQYNALLLLQKLIGIHLADAKPDALIDVDIYRIGFAHTNAVIDNNDELYMQALVRLTTQYGDLPTAAEAWYLEAKYYAEGGQGNAGGGQGNAGEGQDKSKAKAICERVLAQKESSQGQSGCRLLLKSIVQKELALKVEKVNLPGQPFRSLVTWRNFSRLNLRLIMIDSIRRAKPLRVVAEQDYWKQLLHLPVARSFSQDLPDTGDYSFHSTEIPIGGLPPGTYALMGCSDDRWDSLSVITAAEFYISGIAFINQGRDYFVVDRGTGHPLSGAGVSVWKQVYSPASRSWEMVRREFARADGEGHFQLEKLKQGEYGDRLLEITVPGRRPVDPPADRLFMLDEGVPYFPFDDGEDDGGAEQTRGFLLLDRSIYRPGQLVYFKGIVVGGKAEQPKVLAGQQAKLILFNTNNERVDSLEVTTNEFGSFHGSFRLPEHQLNGSFRIGDEEGTFYQAFSVEEYKRPGFEVTLDQPKGSYRVGDSIRVKCSALAYAGNALDGARIKYRVFRQTGYPFFERFRQFPRLSGGRGQEIGHGEGTTDGHGVFNVMFAALPDRRVHRSTNPRFYYTVETDVTDINGETRSGLVRITAGYTVLNLSIDLPEDSRLAADSLKLISVGATNLAGEPVASRVHLAAYPLAGPRRLVRKRLWQAPDRFVLSEAAFLDSFPHDEYRDETNKESWVRGAMAWEVTDSTAGDWAGSGGIGGTRGKIAIGRLSPGWWVIEATTTDAYGQPVKDLRYVELYDGKTGRPANPEYNWAADGESSVEPGGKASTEMGSSAEDVYVIRKQEKAGATFAHFTLNNDKKMTEWAVTEADRGGFGVSDVFIKDNRMFTHRYNVTVPWTNKELQIRYATFRDKTEPGSAEKWAVSIDGSKGRQVTAEVLTAMYDASLDQFKPQSWSVPMLYSQRPEIDGWGGIGEFQEVSGRQRYLYQVERPGYTVAYDRLLEVGQDHRILINGKAFYNSAVIERRLVAGEVDKSVVPLAQTMVRIRGSAKYDAGAVQYKSDVEEVEEVGAGAGATGERPPLVQIRKNFNETAFFFPDLRTDSLGDVSFSFTMPEAVTRWKWMTLAHTRDLAFGYSEKSVGTQKQLMVQPNVPRFLREGDKMNLSVKVVNLTDSEMTGQMGLQLTDPTTGETADGWFVNRQPNQYFTVAARSSEVVDFPVDIPFQYNRPLTYRIVAQAGNYSDGEEATLPVVSNRMLVTETLPLNMPGDGTRSFHFDKLLLSGSDETLNHHALTVEFTANPAWYAVQALPYLMEYPYECAEQTFNRFYSNALASKIANSSPRLAQVFAAWRTTDTAALLSNLQKNQELKSILLEETPWVLQGKTEEQQKKDLALLFDMNRMSGELETTIVRLKELQTSNGGFVWFKGGPDDRYITQYILMGLGHLQQLKALPSGMAGLAGLAGLAAKIKDMVTAALAYTDARIREDYERDRKVGRNGGLGELEVQYLYMRSFFNDYGIPGDAFASVDYFRKKAQQGWVQQSKYMQGMIALALFRTGDVQTARNIIASLRQSAIRDPEKGMYWKDMEGGGYYWYQAPVEVESLLIEAFREIGGDAVADREMKTWLLRQKQTHNWPTTKATADACYALLMGREDWLSAEREIEIKLGDKRIEWPGGSGEAGTGYDKKIFDGPFVNPTMGNITVMMKTPTGGGTQTGGSPVGRTGGSPVGRSPVGGSPAWGAVYWQYFDQLDHITSAGGSKVALRLAKRLFVRRDTDRGPVLDTIPDNGTLKVGDKVVVRIELRSDRDLEYVHMKDMRAACLEPVDVLSGYRWQGGLGYYETTKDASTDFFFPVVPRGTYVFEYTLVAGQTGEFSNGIASVECMYAPEFAFHSEGIRINVEGAP